MGKKKDFELKPVGGPLSEGLKKEHQAAVDAGLIYDPKKIEESGTLATPSKFEGMEFEELPGDYYDKYDDYIDRNTLRGGQLDGETLSSLRAQNQSNWEQAGNAIGRIATNILPQTVSGFASMLDLEGYTNAEAAANNSIVNWAMDLKKEVDEDWFPIYEESPGTSMNISDPAWWMSRGSGLVESIGSFLLQGAGMGKIVSTGLKGLGEISGAKKLTTAVLGAEASQRGYQGIAGLTNAVALNQSEAVLEATQVFRDTYQEQLGKNGGNIAKAKQAASIAASTTMNLNKMNILLNLSSASAFITPLKYTRKLLDAPSLSKNLMHLGFEGGQEAAEELVNHVASKAGMAAGRGKDYTLDNALADIGTMEGFEAAFLGAIGGVGQTGITNLAKRSKYGPGSTKDENGNRISSYENEKNRYDQQQKVLQELKDRGVNTTDVLKSYKDQLVFQDKLTKAHEKAKTTGDYSEVEALKTEMFENQAIKAFQSGTTQVLEDLYKAEAARPVEDIGQEYIDSANNAVKQLKQLEGIYNNFENYSNVDEIFYNRANKNRIERQAKEVENAKKTTDLDLHQQVVEIAKKYEFTNEQEVLFKKEGQVVGTEKRTSTSPLTYSLSDIQRNQGDTEQNQKVYDKFLAEVEKLPTFQKADEYNKQSEAINKTLIENEKEFQTITSREHQQKVAQQKVDAIKVEQLKKDLEKATTKSQVENLKSSTNDEAFRRAADAKLASIELQNVKNSKAKEIQVTVDNFATKINNAKEEELDSIREEINKAELSSKEKQNLLNKVNDQARRLNGEIVEEEDPEGGLSAFGFTATNPEEDGGVVVDTKKNEDDLKNNQANFETSIPSDYVNPDTEKKSIEEGVADAATSLLNTDKTMVVGEDENGNLVYNYSRSEEGFNRAAYLSREFNQTEEVSSVDREEFTNEIENAKVLDPDFLTPGTELVMEVDTEYSGEKYDPTSNTRETIAWNLRLEELQKMADEKGVPLNELDEYIDEVPIKVTTKDGETVFYVHDNAWYREENLDNTIEAIGLDKAKNHEIRKEIIKSGKVKSKVTYKSMGRLFKTYDNKSIPVSEAMPDGNLILAIGRSDSFEVDLNGATLLPSTPQNGRLYAVVPVGKDTYLPIPLERQPLTEESIDSIVFAIEGYLSQDRENPVVKAIRESSLGLDITELAQLGKYISQFVGLFSTEGTQGLEPFLINGGGKNSSLKANHPIIAVTATGIEFGRPGIENGSYMQNGKKVVRFTATISANFKDKDAMYRNKETLDKKLRPMLKAMMSNADRKTLAMDGDAVIILNSQGETSTKKYTEFLKETHKTNILSVNAGGNDPNSMFTWERPKWVYTIQPTILFDTAFADLSKIKPAAVAKGVPKAAPTVTPPAPSTTKAPTAPAIDSIKAQKADIERRRKERLNPISEKNPNGYFENVGVYKKDKVTGEEYYDPEAKNGTYSVDFSEDADVDDFITASSIEELKNKVNAKYDVELDALEGGVSDKKADIEVISENYTPELLRTNPDKLFLFGDNNTRTGKGGQAIIRDEPNAVGISTKLLPKNTPEAFMSDADLASNKAVINDDIYKAKQRAAKEGKTIVLPKGGFGTGLASLATKAPQTFAYLNKRLQEEFGFNNTTAELAALEQPISDKRAEIEAKYNKIIEEEGLNILAPITVDERGLSSQEIQEVRKKQAEQLERDKRLAELNKEKQKELAALEQQPTITSDASSVLQVLNIPTNTVLEEGKNVTMLDNGDIIPQNRKEGLAAAFGLIPVVESKATLSEEEYNNKVKEAKENAPILYQILGLPSQERADLLSDVAAEVSAQVRLEEIERLLQETKSVEKTLYKITNVYRDGKISFPSPSQMQFLIAKAVELGLPIPPISTLYEESLKLLHRTELKEDPYSNIYFTALGILRSRYTAFETLGKSEEELLEMGYPPLQNSYTLEQLQAFAKEELARIKKNNAADYAQWEKGGTSTSLTYKDYKALKDILASNILSLAENNRNLISRQMTERTESVQFIKDLEAAYAAGEVVTPKSIGTTTPETEVETLTGDALIEKHAEELLKSVGDSKEDLEQLEEYLEGLKNIKEAIASNEVSLDQVLPDLQANGFESLEDAIASLQKAVELFNSRAENKDTFVLPDGTIVELDDNTQDANDIDDDTVDEMISPMDATQIEAVRTEVEDMIIRGLDPATQASLISYIASDIISRAMEAKDKGKKEGVKTAPIFAEHKKSLETLEKLYKSKNLVNKAARIRAVLDQFDKVNKLVEQRIRLLTTGTVQEDITLDDSEEAMGLEKVVYTDDWAFTVNSKSTASADLKKFFVGIRAVDENGKPLSNILGLPEIMSFDTVYNTLHELLANRPADYAHMIETLGLYQEKFPWIQAVVDKLEKAPEKIKNEFVSDMAKHHIDMKFLMWSKDRNGNYSLQRWSSNSSSIEQRLRNVWQSNLKGVGTQSNLVTLNEKNEYVYNQDVIDSLIEQAQVFKQDPSKVTNEDLANWLGQFGIVITDDTYRDLRKGDFKNKGKKSWAQLFTNDAGLVFALAKQLKAQRFMLLDDAKILNDSVVKALAKLDALNNMNTFSNSFQAGGKTVYSYGNNNYLVNRMRDLTAYDYANKKFVNQKLIDDLKQISFTKDSLWLNDLTNEGTIGDMTRSTLDIGYLSLEALKKLFTESKDNRKLNNLSTAEHELTKIGFFQRVSGEIVKDHETGVSEQRRSVDFFYPTMSDKTTMLLISGLTRQLKLNAEGNISDENIKLLYKALVTPEINRIRSKQSKNIKGYEPNYFYFLPSLNTLEVEVDGQTRTFLDVVKDGNDSMNEYQVEKAVLDEIRSIFDGLLEKKLADWKKLGIGQEVKDDKGKVIEKYSFMDKAYITDVAKEGKGTNRVKYAAMDYVFNYLIANSEAFKLFAGDPALYGKFSENKTLQENLEETFVNIGKRLAGDIAPGIELANSANNKYYQVFFQDKKLNSNNVKDSIQKEFFEKVITNYAKNYSGIEGSDAQEYTTWQEHLYVMKQLGRITEAQYDTFKTKLEAQSEGIFKRSTQLTFDEMGIIMQPMKPVYVGNISSTEDNADRRVYIKSSSFPLIPELTRGLQIDKIRQSIEKFETEEGTKVTSDGNPAFVRASFGTANKVGAVANAVEVFDNDGNVLDNMEVKLENSLLLSRENFRIQQDVPYKRDKSETNIGTQERTLLFADLLDLKIDGEITGAELMEMYNKQYEELFAYANEKLSKRLGLIQTVTTESNIESLLIIPTGDMFTKAEELSEKLDKASPIEKVKLQQNFADEVGEDTLERVNFINKNFDKIVEQLAKAKMNFFFDETQKENEEFKKCD